LKIQTKDGFEATIAMDHPTKLGTMIATLLNVGSNPKRNCQAEVGIAMLKGAHYGNPIGKILPMQAALVKLIVDEAKSLSQHHFW